MTSELRWYDWRAFGFKTRHATEDGRTALCGSPVPIDARYLERGKRYCCADCVKRSEVDGG